MSNPFLNKTDLVERDIETALLLERAVMHDIGNAVAYTDGDKVFINTEDNLFNILPAYDQRMLKWLLWHEQTHLNLRHHNRFFRYLSELKDEDTLKEFQVTKEEVNIIMDILVHDWMASKFPELIETAMNNLAQFRNRNSLKYTFKTYTLEEMLDEYKAHKEEEAGDKEEATSEEEKDGKDKSEKESPSKETPDGDTKSEPKEKPKSKDKPEKHDIKEDEESEQHEPGGLPDEHDKTDWSKLDKIDDKEFITEEEGRDIEEAVERLKRKRFKLIKLTETLNGLVTSTRRRTYAKPNPIKVGGGVVLKGSTPGRAQLYLIFDASGSMSYEMNLFKDIISKSIPQAMECTCEWFAGCNASITPYKKDRGDGYFKGKFKDFLPVRANNGYNDDGDRTIELCWQAEQLGYTPIGVTDGGGSLGWSKDKLKQLKRTVLIGDSESWLERVKEINPNIQTLYVD